MSWNPTTYYSEVQRIQKETDRLAAELGAVVVTDEDVAAIDAIEKSLNDRHVSATKVLEAAKAVQEQLQRLLYDVGEVRTASIGGYAGRNAVSAAQGQLTAARTSLLEALKSGGGR